MILKSPFTNNFLIGAILWSKPNQLEDLDV